jgi:arsenate reductase (thioredoxin)
MIKRVLVLCTGNSCRSQMAEGFFRALGSGNWEAFSAGSEPSGYVHPLAIAAMQEISIDISNGRSKSINEFEGQKFELVVTVCDHANEACPFFPAATSRQHWPFDDPANATGGDKEKMRVFRRVRDEIGDAVKLYLENG